MTSSDASSIRVHVELASGVEAGEISIEELSSASPSVLRLESKGAGCEGDGALALHLNGTSLPLASCEGGLLTFGDPAAVAALWRAGEANDVRLEKRGPGGVRGLRLIAGSGRASASTRLLDSGGDVSGAFDVSVVLPPAETAEPRLVVPFSGSALPESIDLRSLSDGRHALCVSSGDAAQCTTFVREGEPELRLEVAGGTNPPPTAQPNAGSTNECTSPQGANVHLDGTQSTDDGVITSFAWYVNHGGPGEQFLGAGPVLDVTLPLGSHLVTLVVTDAQGATGSAGVTHTVADTTAPKLTVGVTPPYLWPADHRMVPVSTLPEASDICGGTTVSLRVVLSNEPDDRPGDVDGNTTGDIQDVTVGTADTSFLLRAETGAVFGGRRYAIVYVAEDATGNRSIGSGIVAVKPFRPITRVEDDPKTSLSPR